MNPTIVTPLLEHGGKAIACAAGVSHSLVVVMTEERRLAKAHSYDLGDSTAANKQHSHHQHSSRQPTESIVHHQLYGFGRNDFTKIGLVSPKLAKSGSQDEMECVLLPRRVALRCKVRPDLETHNNTNNNETPPQGIFAIAASVEHSAALVRRASGDVELYTWGNAMKGALGLPQAMAGLDGLAGQVNMSSTLRVVPVPSFVAKLSKTSNPDARSTSLLLLDEGEHPVHVALGPHCSFVVTSMGRCFSFGMSEDGMLGLGEGMMEASQPSEICLPLESRAEAITSIGAGASHVVASTGSGNVYAWGCKMYAGLGGKNNDNNGIAWYPRRVLLDKETVEIQGRKKQQPHIVQACAGYDCSVYVADSGQVLSCGKNSGRLGLGELKDDVTTPKPLYGGFRLWQRRRREPLVVGPTDASLRKGPALTRGITLS